MLGGGGGLPRRQGRWDGGTLNSSPTIVSHGARGGDLSQQSWGREECGRSRGGQDRENKMQTVSTMLMLIFVKKVIEERKTTRTSFSFAVEWGMGMVRYEFPSKSVRAKQSEHCIRSLRLEYGSLPANPYLCPHPPLRHSHTSSPPVDKHGATII